MLPPWILYAVLGGLSSNLFNFISRYILKDGDDATSWAWLYEAFRLAIFLPLLFFDYRLDLNLYSVFLLIALGITEFISVYFYMKMHAFNHLSISTILSRTRLVWIPLFAYFTIGERLSLPAYFGIALLFLGVSIVKAPHKLFLDKGTIYANLAAIVIAVNIILLKLATPVASGTVVLFFYTLPSVFLFPLFMKNSKKRLVEIAKKNFILKAVASTASIAAGYLLIESLKTGDTSKANAIYQSMMVTGVIAGIIFLKEKDDTWKKIVGSMIALAGVMLLT